MSSSSSFFPPAPPPSVDLDDQSPHLSAAWQGPPWHTRPGIAALSVELGRSDSTVVAIQGAEVYPAGVVLSLVVHVRETGHEARRRLFAQLEIYHGRGQLGLDAGGLRWGVGYPDGRKVTTLDESPWAAGVPDDADPLTWSPARPFLDGLSRPSAWASTWRRGVWVWPLPPPGSMTLVCAWPDRQIAETATEADTAPLHRAAGESVPVW